MDVEKKLADLRTDVESAKQRKLRAEMETETALRERDQALKALKDEFGVDSIEEANSLLRSLNDELENAISEAEKIIKDVE